MSTGVNEYPLSQSLSNPASKMPPSLIRSAIIPEGRPLASSSQPQRDCSRFDALSHIPIFLYFATLWWNWMQILLGDLLLLVAMKQSNSCLIYPLVYLYCFVSFYQCFFLPIFLFCSFSLDHSIFSILLSSQRCEQVIATYPSYSPFVMGKWIFLCFHCIFHCALFSKILGDFYSTMDLKIHRNVIICSWAWCCYTFVSCTWHSSSYFLNLILNQ